MTTPKDRRRADDDTRKWAKRVREAAVLRFPTDRPLTSDEFQSYTQFAVPAAIGGIWWPPVPSREVRNEAFNNAYLNIVERQAFSTIVFPNFPAFVAWLREAGQRFARRIESATRKSIDINPPRGWDGQRDDCPLPTFVHSHPWPTAPITESALATTAAERIHWLEAEAAVDAPRPRLTSAKVDCPICASEIRLLGDRVCPKCKVGIPRGVKLLLDSRTATRSNRASIETGDTPAWRGARRRRLRLSRLARLLAELTYRADEAFAALQRTSVTASRQSSTTTHRGPSVTREKDNPKHRTAWHADNLNELLPSRDEPAAVLTDQWSKDWVAVLQAEDEIESILHWLSEAADSLVGARARKVVDLKNRQFFLTQIRCAARRELLGRSAERVFRAVEADRVLFLECISRDELRTLLDNVLRIRALYRRLGVENEYPALDLNREEVILPLLRDPTKVRGLTRSLKMDRLPRKILDYQRGRCAVCARPQSSSPRRFPVDHRHKDGLIRGILCPFDNQLLGVVREDTKRLRAAADYLESPPAPRALGRRVYGRRGRIQKPHKGNRLVFPRPALKAAA